MVFFISAPGSDQRCATARLLNFLTRSGGKILRIDVRRPPMAHHTNKQPFFWKHELLPEIWIRISHPWRFSFDRLTGDLFIGDVGENNWEEIDFEPSGSGGRNYGWDIREGNHDFKSTAWV